MESIQFKENPELMEDFSNIWTTLEKINNGELDEAGDFYRSSPEKFKLIEKKSEKKEIYKFILQIIPTIIGWILNKSLEFLEFARSHVEKKISESYNVLSEDFNRFESFQEFARHFNFKRAFALFFIILLPTIYVLIKFFCIIINFLLSEIPFE